MHLKQKPLAVQEHVGGFLHIQMTKLLKKNAYSINTIVVIIHDNKIIFIKLWQKLISCRVYDMILG
jgi:hypothetical protein